MAEAVVVENASAAGRWLLEKALFAAREAVARRGEFIMALSGGASPLPFYRLLAAADFPWKQTQLWLVDERFVAPEHPDHNGAAIRAIFSPESGAVLAPGQLHLIDTTVPDRVEAAARYAAELAVLAGDRPWPVFDFILLGMGADGHTASLFPGTGAARLKDRLAVAVMPLSAPHGRISLSLPVLNAARLVIVLVLGESKRQVLAKVLAGVNPELPASLLASANGELVFLADKLSAPR